MLQGQSQATSFARFLPLNLQDAVRRSAKRNSFSAFTTKGGKQNQFDNNDSALTPSLPHSLSNRGKKQGNAKPSSTSQEPLSQEGAPRP